MKSAVEQINELKCWDFSITYGGYKHAEEVVVVRKDDIFKILEVCALSLLTRKECRGELIERDIEEIIGKFEGEKMKTKIELNHGFKGSGINEVDTSRLVKEALRMFSLIPCEKGENPLMHLQELAEIGIDIGRQEVNKQYRNYMEKSEARHKKELIHARLDSTKRGRREAFDEMKAKDNSRKKKEYKRPEVKA